MSLKHLLDLEELARLFVNMDGAIAAMPEFQLIPTVRSMGVVKLDEAIRPTEGYHTPGSVGSLSLQIAVTLANTKLKIFGGSWELVVILMKSGVCVKGRGAAACIPPGWRMLLRCVRPSKSATVSEPSKKDRCKFLKYFRVRSKLGQPKTTICQKQVSGEIGRPYAKGGHGVLNLGRYAKSGVGASAG